MFLCECETCLEGLGKRGRNKAADTARRGCFELRSGGVEEKCGLRLHATVLSKSSVLQFHSVAMNEGDPRVDTIGIDVHLQIHLGRASGYPG